ncbi:hypothetical protein K501DRAFT_248246 [Backusella circina FSU 941]|nr:hypothetical protein K501DRAFT_248246 [Backusella circina FSU 941]
MNGHSLHGTRSYSSTFQWSAYDSSINKYKPSTKELPSSLKDITVKEILVKYDNDPELLKYILSAKAEEDKRSSAKDVLKTQEVRIQLKQIDIDIAREQAKAHACYEQPPFQAQGVPFSKLAPVQEQVLARFSYPHQSTPKNHHPLPPSPATLYPHSAHPLCPSNNLNDNYGPPLPNLNAPYRFKNQDAKNHLKRNRSSISNDTTDKQSHNKVIEALKAKIRRSSTSDSTSLKEKVVGASSSAAVRKQEHSVIPLSPSSLSPSSAKSHLTTIETQMNEKKNSYCNGKGDKADTPSDTGHSSKVTTPRDNQEQNYLLTQSLSPCFIKNI